MDTNTIYFIDSIKECFHQNLQYLIDCIEDYNYYKPYSSVGNIDDFILNYSDMVYCEGRVNGCPDCIYQLIIDFYEDDDLQEIA